MISLEEILGRLHEAIVVLDSDKRVLTWRGGAVRMFGWSADEIEGANIDEILKPVDANDNPTCIGPPDPKRVLSIIKGVPEHEVLVTTKNGKRLWLGVTCSFDRNSDRGIERIVVVARDITRRKRVDLAKSEVISAVSHELRSPLTSVKGFVSTLINKWDQLTEEQKKHFLNTIQVDADRVTRLINELLDISRLETGRLQLRKQRVEIQDIARKVMERLTPRAERHTIRMELNGTLPPVMVDPDKVEQVLTNLVENAMKYTDEGTITVGCSLDGEVIRVSVSDEGEGIPAEHLSQVFGKFFRRGERVGSPSGTGLGLYISKGLIEAHGGKIWVEDAEGGGAVFTFTLPLPGS